MKGCPLFDALFNRLSERFKVSRYHLSRRFSETYDLPLHQFLLRLQRLFRLRAGIYQHYRHVPSAWRALEAQHPPLKKEPSATQE